MHAPVVDSVHEAELQPVNLVPGLGLDVLLGVEVLDDRRDGCVAEGFQLAEIQVGMKRGHGQIEYAHILHPGSMYCRFEREGEHHH